MQANKAALHFEMSTAYVVSVVSVAHVAPLDSDFQFLGILSYS